MKTAVSIRDDIYQKAEQAARQLGLSRSKLYSLAILEYVQTHRPEAITAKLNEVYRKINFQGEHRLRLDDDIMQANYDLFSTEEW